MKNRLAKSVSVILLTIAFVVAGGAQTNCDLQSKSASLLLDLQIGMLPEQARNNFGKDLKIKIKKNGERTFFQNYVKKPAPESLRGVRALYLRFFDRRLYQIEIFYEPRADLSSLDTTVNALAAQLDLSAADWQIKNDRARINCSEISLVADYILNARVELTDETVRAASAESRRRDEK